MIFTVTLNPAIDKILFLDQLQQSRTNRLTKTLETIGGKGTHIFVNLSLLGIRSTALGIAVGDTGRKIIRMLEDFGDNVGFLHYDLPGLESRTNYEIVEGSEHTCTMLAERGPTLPRRLTDDLVQQIRTLVNPGDALVLTGDASNVEDTTIYSQLAVVVQELGAKVFLDASGPYLKESLSAGPHLIKPNLEELSFITGRDLKTETDIVAAMQALEKFHIHRIALTWSSNGAIVKEGSDAFRVHPLQVKAVNEAGCGDAFLSGLLAGLERNIGVVETLKLAAAVAAAAAESESTVGFDLARAEELKGCARVTRLIF